tara:strand:- start:759 stop:1640 length:882 start_codon:yes stop_codon:yes gene_type:complete
MANIFLKPIMTEKWHGLHKVGRTKFQDTQDVIQVLFDRKKGALATGLDDDTEARLSSSLGVNLANNSTNEFWHDFKIKLKDQTMIFDTSKPMEELQVFVLKASKFIANSQKELEQGLWPSAKYVIYDEQTEIEKQAAEVQTKAKAIDIFNNLSPEKKLDILKLYGKAVENSSNDFVYTKLYEIVEDNPIDFITQATKSPEEIKVKALIFDLEKLGILRRKGTAYLYNDQQVGFDYDDTVSYLLSPGNQELLVKLKDTLEMRKPGYSPKKEVIEEITEEVKETKTTAKKKTKKD